MSLIREEIENIKSGKSELRKFGLTMGVVFILLGGLIWWRGKDYYLYLICLSGIFISLSIVVPSVLKPIIKGWMTLAILMSWVMTRVLLSLLFYLGFTPLGILARLLGKDFLGLKFDKHSTTTYWIPKEKMQNRNYENQF